MALRAGATAEPNAEQLAALRTRDARAVQLALAGATYDQIAEELQYADRSGAWKAVRRALDRAEAADVLSLRDTELARLDRLQMALWGLALEGDHQAIDRVLKVMERRARLLGLDHADGVAERKVRLDEQRSDVMIRVLQRVLVELRERTSARLGHELPELAGEVIGPLVHAAILEVGAEVA